MRALRDIDRGLAWLGWIAAGLLVLMLFIGPQVVAEDEPGKEQPAYSDDGGGDGGGGTGGGGTDAGAGAGADGEQLFVDNCGSCHTLSAAGTTGSVGPSLDGAALSAEQVSSIVASGSGSMPSFSDTLDDAEIGAVAEYVARASQ